MEGRFDKGIREDAMRAVDDVIELLVEKFPPLSLEKCHQILDTSKEVLTLLSMNGYRGIKKTEKECQISISSVSSSDS